MLLTWRGFIIFVLGAPIVALGAVDRLFVWAGIAYLLLAATLLGLDVWLSPRPRELAVARAVEPRLALGGENPITVTVENRSRYPLAFQVRDTYPQEFPSSDVIMSGRVEGKANAALRYSVRPLRRGDYAFGDVFLRYRGILGFFTRQASYPQKADVKVYPNLREVRKYELLARKGALVEFGLRPARLLGGGSEFERLREYTSDDEYRTIDWPATARNHKPIARAYQPERSQNVMIVLDTGRMMAPPVADLTKLDHGINTALMLAYVTLRKGDRVGLMTFSDDVNLFIAPGGGQRQFYKLLEALYNTQHQFTEPDYRKALSYLALKQRKRALVVIFSDLIDRDSSRQLMTYLAKLAPRHLPLAVTISDPNILTLARQSPVDGPRLYQRVIAEQLLDERRQLFETLARAGVLGVDVPADQLTVAVVSKYLELKMRGRL